MLGTEDQVNYLASFSESRKHGQHIVLTLSIGLMRPNFTSNQSNDKMNNPTHTNSHTNSHTYTSTQLQSATKLIARHKDKGNNQSQNWNSNDNNRSRQNSNNLAVEYKSDYEDDDNNDDDGYISNSNRKSSSNSARRAEQGILAHIYIYISFFVFIIVSLFYITYKH